MGGGGAPPPHPPALRPPPPAASHLPHCLPLGHSARCGPAAQLRGRSTHPSRSGPLTLRFPRGFTGVRERRLPRKSLSFDRVRLQVLGTRRSSSLGRTVNPPGCARLRRSLLEPALGGAAGDPCGSETCGREDPPPAPGPCSGFHCIPTYSAALF